MFTLQRVGGKEIGGDDGKNKRVEECELWGSGKSNRKEERVEKLGIDQTTINTISQRVKRDNFQSVDFSHFLLIGRYT